MGPERPPQGDGLVLGTMRYVDMTKAEAVTRPGLSFKEKPRGFLIFFPIVAGSGDCRVTLAFWKWQLFTFMGGKSGHRPLKGLYWRCS